jgi:hypothetical protein
LAALKNRRAERDMDIARWFETYKVKGSKPELPELTPGLSDQLTSVLRSDEVQVILQELIAVRLTDSPNTAASRVRMMWEGTLALAGP